MGSLTPKYHHDKTQWFTDEHLVSIVSLYYPALRDSLLYTLYVSMLPCMSIHHVLTDYSQRLAKGP